MGSGFFRDHTLPVLWNGTGCAILSFTPAIMTAPLYWYISCIIISELDEQGRKQEFRRVQAKSLKPQG
jgi:hypothetical protein